MPTSPEPLVIRQEDDVVYVRKEVRRQAVEIGFGLVDQTKIVTAASELARNTLVHGGGGEMRVEVVEQGGGRGLRLTFSDQGPGIPDLEQALRDGFTTGGGLGLGLGGARRLVSDFVVDTAPGRGTRVTITKWR
ncbi:MAG TPA: anti-sigma regulatory factor [Thermoanaerobaculia bacterium]|nr:anti-sigma regulatory factor [Thermoanaerobaculia bacterium]